MQDWVERFPYQDGLLISYWDGSQGDNNTSEHPGEGLILPIDAHPQTMYRADGVPWRPRVQGYDSPFGRQRTDAITLHRNSQASHHPSLRGAPIFNAVSYTHLDVYKRQLICHFSDRCVYLLSG